MLRAISVVLFSILFTVTGTSANTNSSSSYIVHDAVRRTKPTNEQGSVALATNIPNWDTVDTGGRIRYIEMLIVADSGVSQYFNRDTRKLRRAVATLMQALNLYVHQIGVRISVVDVIEMSAHNVTLERFSQYRSEKFKDWPDHDIAILISSSYEGGIAYVNGICSHNAVGIIGFFANAPMEYAAILFHELAHLFGLSHDATSQCSCENTDYDERCLKIDGFDNDCSVQALVDKLADHLCIQAPPSDSRRNGLPVCGNQIIEQGEECDCGPERFCTSMVCDPISCKRTISDLQLLTVLTAVTSALSMSLCIIHRCRQPTRQTSFSNLNVGVTKKVWDTPTFMPLATSLSESQAPLWNTSGFRGDNSAFGTPQTSPMKFLDPQMTSTPNRESVIPPLPPRMVQYVNINPAKSVDSVLPINCSSFTSSPLHTTQTLDRRIGWNIPVAPQQSQSALLLCSPPRQRAPIARAAHDWPIIPSEPPLVHAPKPLHHDQRTPYQVNSSRGGLSHSANLDHPHRDLITTLSQCLEVDPTCLDANCKVPSSRHSRVSSEDPLSMVSESNRFSDLSSRRCPIVSSERGNHDNLTESHLVRLALTPQLTRVKRLADFNRSASFNELMNESRNQAA